MIKVLNQTRILAVFTIMFSIACGGGDGSQSTGPIDDGQCGPTKLCAAGQSCESGFCVDLGAICTTCGTSADCLNGMLCSQVGSSLHCTPPCTNDGDCGSGWVCNQSSNGTGATCIPEVNHCTGCLSEGCDSGQICNPSTGMCTTHVKQCGICVDDGQCGMGFRCHGKQGGTKFCVPECSSGACPANGTCVDAGNNISLCEWTSEGPCCFGSTCGASTDPCDSMECTQPTPVCLNGVCVGCTKDTDCPAGQTCTDALVCEAATQQCSGETPWFNAALNKCCECLNSSHCGGGTCLTTTCLCEGNNPTGNICDTCSDPYPGCAEFQGQWVCVQCSEDSHCGTNQCDLNTYTCQGGGAAPAQGNCGSQGCAPGLQCDANSGLCYDPEGNCDNVTSFCPNGGECVDLLSQLTGGLPGGGGLPIPAGGGLPGNCTCTGPGDCPAGLSCSAGLMGLLTGGSGSGTECASDTDCTVSGEVCNPPLLPLPGMPGSCGPEVKSFCSSGGGLPFP